MKTFINADLVVVKSESFGPKPVLLTQKAYADFIRLASRSELLAHEFEFTPLKPEHRTLDFFGSLDLKLNRDRGGGLN